jgi:hypothetical protein
MLSCYLSIKPGQLHALTQDVFDLLQAGPLSQSATQLVDTDAFASCLFKRVLLQVEVLLELEGLQKL